MLLVLAKVAKKIRDEEEKDSGLRINGLTVAEYRELQEREHQRDIQRLREARREAYDALDKAFDEQRQAVATFKKQKQKKKIAPKRVIQKKQDIWDIL